MSAYFGDWAQFTTLFDVALLLAVSWGVGVPLRRGGGIANTAWGFLTLGGAAALTYHGFRALQAPVWPYIPAVLVITAVLVATLRAMLPPRPAERDGTAVLVAVGGLTVILLPLRLAQADPSSGLSTLVGWLPLYLKSCFAAGHFLGVDDMAAGPGVLSSYYYMTDLAGLAAALARLTAPEAPYAAYLATSITAALLTLAVLATGLRRSPAALTAFVFLVVAGLGLDPFFRTVVARHYGDGFLLLGGALIVHAIATGRDGREAAIAAAAASIFLVFGRHYGALYAALVLAVGFVVGRGWREWPVWMALGLLLAVFSVREALWIIAPPSPYYPGAKLVALLQRDAAFWIKGGLYDLGLYWADSPVELLSRALWLVALVLAVPLLRRRSVPRGRLLAPLALFALPAILVALSGYRSGISYNKLTIITLAVLPWYPAWLLSHHDVARRWDLRLAALRLPAGIVPTGLALALVAGLLVVPPIRRIYQDKLVDRATAMALRTELGEDGLRRVAEGQLLYWYYEPGSGLRNYIGGDLMGDLDFWGGAVWNRMDGAGDLTALMAAIGWPNIYFSAHAHYGEFVDSRWRKFEGELAAIESQPWVERVVRAGNARLVIVRRPPG